MEGVNNRVPDLGSHAVKLFNKAQIRGVKGYTRTVDAMIVKQENARIRGDEAAMQKPITSTSNYKPITLRNIKKYKEKKYKWVLDYWCINEIILS